jgi:tetratricopeptide (TPR) repeat protein
VSRESLVDALWGEGPPNNPANAVQGRISRLRRALIDIGLSDRLVSAHGPGYVAAVDPGQVDAHRFTSLIQQARAAAGDNQTAAGLYAEALALWRGPALADFASEPWAMTEMAERAEEAGETEQVAATHARYYADLAETGQTRLRGPEQSHWLQLLRQERHNIDAALLWTQRQRDDDDLGLRLVAALGWFWYFTSNQNAVGQIEEMLHRHAGASPAARAHAVQAKSIVARPGSCIVHPSQVCGAAARQSLEELDLLGEQRTAAHSRALLAVEAIAAPLQPSADELLTAARTAFHDTGDRWGSALTLFVEMELQFAAGHLDSGRTTYRQALELFRELGDHWGISAVQYHLGMALHRAGLLTEALEVYRAALSEGRIGLTNTVQYALANLGHISLLIGDLDGADAYFSSAHAVARELGGESSPLALLGPGDLVRLQGQPNDAAPHYTAALEELVQADTPDWTATALNGLAHLAHQRGDDTLARRHYRAAWTLVTDAGTPRHPAAATVLEGLAGVAVDEATTAPPSTSSTPPPTGEQPGPGLHHGWGFATSTTSQRHSPFEPPASPTDCCHRIHLAGPVKTCATTAENGRIGRTGVNAA